MFLIPTVQEMLSLQARPSKSEEQLAEEEEEKTPFERALSARAAQVSLMTPAVESTNFVPSGETRGNVAAMANPYLVGRRIRSCPKRRSADLRE